MATLTVWTFDSCTVFCETYFLPSAPRVLDNSCNTRYTPVEIEDVFIST